MSLEGLRGVAAVVVIAYHALNMFFVSFAFGPDADATPLQNGGFESFLYNSLFGGFLSGAFAVAIFFVLSGFVLSIGFFETGKTEIIKKLAGKRYLRLMLPALASIMVTWLLLSLGADYIKDQVAATSGSGWLENQWTVTPDFTGALSQGLWSIFWVGDASYNPPLWTMKLEILGSFLIFGTLLLFGKLKHRWVIYGLLLAATIHTWYLGFVIGMILADLYAKKMFPFGNINTKIMLIFLGIGVLLGGYPNSVADGSIYHFMKLGFLSDVETQTFYIAVGAMLVVIAVLTIPILSRIFSSKIITLLGRYSFSMYLVHTAVLFTVTGGVYLLLQDKIGANYAGIVGILAGIPSIALAAYYFEKFVDGPSIRVSGIFSNWLLGLPQNSGVAAYAPSVSEKTRRKSARTAVNYLKHKIFSKQKKGEK